MYGPVHTVVWQGSVSDHRPYADLRPATVGALVMSARENGKLFLRAPLAAVADSSAKRESRASFVAIQEVIS